MLNLKYYCMKIFMLINESDNYLIIKNITYTRYAVIQNDYNSTVMKY